MAIRAPACTRSEVDAERSLRAISGSRRRHAPTAAAVRYPRDGMAVASWVEYAEGRTDFRLRRLDRTGAKSPGMNIVAFSGGRAGGFPRMARQGDELVLAWSESASENDESGALKVSTAIAELP